MLKPLKIKRLSDVCKTVENQRLDAYSKATPKQQIVERQASDEIFWSFGVIFGKGSFLSPTDPPDQPLPTPTLNYTFFLYITFLHTRRVRNYPHI
jgi:hypothetical protein